MAAPVVIFEVENSPGEDKKTTTLVRTVISLACTMSLVAILSVVLQVSGTWGGWGVW
jgi:hypothetical protein